MRHCLRQQDQNLATHLFPGSKMIKLEFANPRFSGCFEIAQNLCNSIPKNIECIGNVVIKVEAAGNYKIIDCKVQP